MPYLNIFVANESILKLKNNQLIVDNGEEYSFPIEDIRSIVIDNPYSKLTAKLMSYLGQEGVCLILCDDKHTPCCQLLPVGTYCRNLKRIELQYSQSKPKMKRIWQIIVIKKIENQARCLEICDKEGYSKLLAISKSVQSGDTTNREGYAASLYFKALFGKNFTRSQECDVNSALNYGYAIIRSFIAKNIVAYGFEPSMGIHHKNELNSFNLADDLIEPFRPIVDLFVSSRLDMRNGFGTSEKAQLQKLLNCVCVVNGENWSLSRATELLIQSIVYSFENDKIELKLPDIVPTSYFDYD